MLTRRDRTLGGIAVVLAVLIGAGVDAGTLDPSSRARSERFAIASSSSASASSEPRLLGERGGLGVWTLDSRERALAARVLESRARMGDGGGAQITDVTLFQTGYRGSGCLGNCNGQPCNTAILVWTETAAKPAGTDVLFDGNVISTVPGLPAGSLPGLNGINLVGISAGRHTFRAQARDNGSFGEIEMVILDDQPFSDPDLTCSAGAVNPNGICDMIVGIANPGPLPDFYGVIVDGSALGEVEGTTPSVTIQGLSAGEHCAELFGFLENAQGRYRGCFIETCCTLTCRDTACDPPVNLQVCQLTYGPEGGALEATWQNGETNYSRLTVTFNATTVATPAGDQTGALFDAPLGEGTVAVRGSCGIAGSSTTAQAPFIVLDATPHTNPIEGGIVQSWTAGAGGTGTTSAMWTNADPSIRIDVFVLSGGELFFAGSLAGTAEGVNVDGTVETDVLLFQFFALVGGLCYGSDLLGLETPPGESYVPGFCDGVDSMSISSAIFLLDYLFRSGPVPSCVQACDCNGDGRANVSDASCILSFLFQSGPAPIGWKGREPTCVEIGDGDDCETPTARCAPN